MACEDQIYSNEFYDFILQLDLPGQEIPAGYCNQPVDSLYSILYAAREGLPPLNISNYTYSVIPKCFIPVDQTALEVSGILKVQNQPTLSLMGQGILIGFVDTGIAYTNPVFQNSDKTTRIAAIWDQTIPGRPPEGFLCGTEYVQSEINEALSSENPLETVPSTDEDGHGTFVAGVAAGSVDYANNFSGAAPQTTIAVVKLKPAKQYLKDYYFIAEDAVVYAENDIMTGVYYLKNLARKLNMPLALCVAMGTSMGSHGGTGHLANYLDYVAIRTGNVVTAAAGNEANTRHHYSGQLDAETRTDSVEVNVEQGVRGFAAELWVRAPELYTIAVTSPSGESVPKMQPYSGNSATYRFIFEETVVSIDYRTIGARTGDQLIYIRFDRPTRGIWTIQVYGVNFLGKDYHIWLPMREMMSGEVFFIRSNPDTTITAPANGQILITVGAYDARDGSLYINSGRGYTIDGRVKPDFTAPGVNVYGPAVRGGYQIRSGTSISAAITAGAGALFLEWAILYQNLPGINSVEAKNFFIRGAVRDSGRIYPNREWGYGKLDLYNAFDILRT